jgi:hypothetical protein
MRTQRGPEQALEFNRVAAVRSAAFRVSVLWLSGLFELDSFYFVNLRGMPWSLVSFAVDFQWLLSGRDNAALGFSIWLVKPPPFKHAIASQAELSSRGLSQILLIACRTRSGTRKDPRSLPQLESKSRASARLTLH